MSGTAFTVPGAVVPWQRTASYRGRRLTPKRQRDYQRNVRLAAQRAAGRWPLDARYVLAVDVYEPDARRRDLDNCVKTIADACNGVLWADDAQIDVLLVSRLRDRQAPRVEVRVRTLEPHELDEEASA